MCEVLFDLEQRRYRRNNLQYIHMCIRGLLHKTQSKCLYPTKFYATPPRLLIKNYFSLSTQIILPLVIEYFTNLRHLLNSQRAITFPKIYLFTSMNKGSMIFLPIQLLKQHSLMSPQCSCLFDIFKTATCVSRIFFPGYAHLFIYPYYNQLFL